jgi:hypothetical protein
MLTNSLACHGERTVAAVEIEVAPTGHCHDLTNPGFTPFAGAPVDMNRSRPGARTRERSRIA